VSKATGIQQSGVHTSLTFMAVTGKWYGDAGLSDLLCESEFVGTGSAAGVLEGCHYNRAQRVHKLVMEAFFRLRWKAFMTWLEEQTNNVDQQDVIECMKRIHEEVSAENFQMLMD
jgi:hypothetical protein